MEHKKFFVLKRKKRSPERYLPGPIHGTFRKAMHNMLLPSCHTSLNRPNAVLSMCSVYFFKRIKYKHFQQSTLNIGLFAKHEKRRWLPLFWVTVTGECFL